MAQHATCRTRQSLLQPELLFHPLNRPHMSCTLPATAPFTRGKLCVKGCTALLAVHLSPSTGNVRSPLAATGQQLPEGTRPKRLCAHQKQAAAMSRHAGPPPAAARKRKLRKRPATRETFGAETATTRRTAHGPTTKHKAG